MEKKEVIAESAIVERGSRPRQTLPSSRVAALTHGQSDNRLLTRSVPFPAKIYLFLVVLPIWFNLGPLFLSGLRVFLLIVTIPIMIKLLRGDFGKMVPVDILFLAYLAWTAVAIAVNTPAQAITQIGSVGVEFIGGYLIGRAYIRRIEDFLSLSRWLIWCVLILCPFAVYEALTSRPVIVDLVQRLPFFESVAVVDVEKRLGLDRAQVVFAHPIHFGLFCSIAFSLSFVALRGLISSNLRWILGFLIAATGFLALSSGAFLATLLQTFLIFWSYIMRSVAGRWWILLTAAVASYIVIDAFSNRTAMEVFFSYATFSAHTAYWRSIIFEWGIANVVGSSEKGISASPWVGIGLNDWIRPHFMRSSSVDNFWLLTSMRYGLVGFAFLAMGYLSGILQVMRRDFSADSVLAQIRLAWVFIFIGMTFTLSTVHIWTNLYSFCFFIYGAGMWLISVPSEAQEESSVPEISPHQILSHSRFAPVRRKTD